ncbi:MAG: LuxR C-terminal-related transcriptional regulator [Gordonibacter sp.]|nr:LuxR C-terminal-related transcriptional regulator [Gordonibacter sp.]
MGIKVPRITINADYGEESSFGELSLISIGYGLHQAWVYAVMFGTSALFGVQTYVSGLYGSHISLTFLVSIVVFGFCLLVVGGLNRKLAVPILSRKTLLAASILASGGTALLMLPLDSSSAMFVLEVIAGVLTGIGSALLILHWGAVYARCDGSSIVLNSAIAIAIGFGVYAVFLRHAPAPLGAILTALIPLMECALLWKKVAGSSHVDIPVFNPLPVKQGKFALKFGIPVFVFGLALGMLRQTSIQSILPAATAIAQIIMLLAAGTATVLILITILAIGDTNRWNRFFRPLVPFIAVALFFLPFSGGPNSELATAVLLIAYMCFEALMWIFFGELAQRFRLSPLFVYGLGRGLLALAALAGSLLPIVAADWGSQLPFGENSLLIVVLIVIVVAYALLPDERDIEASVAPSRTAVPNARHNATLDAPAESALKAKELSDTLEKSGNSTSEHSEVAKEKNTVVAPGSSPLIAASLQAQESESERGGSGRFRTKCETVANTYLLSSRETEVMFFLAKGHNSAYIQEKLYISEGTAKTHIRHIYRKLDVHTQQELMRLVEVANSCE